jgi:hypothetical protein
LATGLPDGIFFKTNIPLLGKFWRFLQWKMLVYFTVIWYILWPLGIAYGNLVYFFPVLVRCPKKNLATLLVKSQSEACS